MTNEEKSKEIARNNQQFYYENDECYDIKSSDEECYDSAMEMAEWKDKQFVQEKEKLIDNVCKWIKNNIHDYMMTGDGEIIDTFDEMDWLDDMFGDLKETMKEV